MTRIVDSKFKSRPGFKATVTVDEASYVLEPPASRGRSGWARNARAALILENSSPIPTRSLTRRLSRQVRPGGLELRMTAARSSES